MADPQAKIRKLLTDASSPYFIDAADHPRTALVDVALTHTNYSSWSDNVHMALCTRNKLGFIDGTVPFPADPDIQPLWTRVANMIMSWILNSIDVSIRSSLANSRTPRELWCEIQSCLTKRDNVTAFQIYRGVPHGSSSGKTTWQIGVKDGAPYWKMSGGPGNVFRALPSIDENQDNNSEEEDVAVGRMRGREEMDGQNDDDGSVVSPGGKRQCR